MKEFFVSLFVIIFVAAVVVFGVFPPKVYVTFISAQNSVLAVEQKQITDALLWQYSYNPLRVGREYQINMPSPAPLKNPAKQDYQYFIWASVKSLSFVKESEAGDNTWNLVLAKDKNGNWKIVADKLCCGQGVDEWY